MAGHNLEELGMGNLAAGIRVAVVDIPVAWPDIPAASQDRSPEGDRHNPEADNRSLAEVGPEAEAGVVAVGSQGTDLDTGAVVQVQADIEALVTEH